MGVNRDVFAAPAAAMACLFVGVNVRKWAAGLLCGKQICDTVNDTGVIK